MMSDPRIDALEDLLSLRRPVPEAIERLRAFPFDSAQPLVVLTREKARATLLSYISGDVDAESLVAWACALEGRDDVALEADYEEVLRQFLFEVSSPEINGDVDSNVASRWIERLE